MRVEIRRQLGSFLFFFFFFSLDRGIIIPMHISGIHCGLLFSPSTQQRCCRGNFSRSGLRIPHKPRLRQGDLEWNNTHKMSLATLKHPTSKLSEYNYLREKQLGKMNCFKQSKNFFSSIDLYRKFSVCLSDSQ